MIKNFSLQTEIKSKSKLSKNIINEEIMHSRDVLFLIVQRLMKLIGILERNTNHIIHLSPWDEELKDQICGVDFNLPFYNLIGNGTHTTAWFLRDLSIMYDELNAKGYFRDDTGDCNLSMDISVNEDLQLVFSSNTMQEIVFIREGNKIPDYIKHVARYHSIDKLGEGDPLYHDYIIDATKAGYQVQNLIRLIIKRIIITGILIKDWWRRESLNFEKRIALELNTNFLINDKVTKTNFLKAYSFINDVIE